MKTIRAERFAGTAEQAFIEAVARNVKHGLPLALQDRIRAARRVLEDQPRWSDRRLATLCGLAPSTVSRIRMELAAQNKGAARPATRVGADGRVRPSSPGDARRRVVTALEKNPRGSLRAIASMAEVSHETVRVVRRSLDAATQSSSQMPPVSARRWPADGVKPSSSLIPIRLAALMLENSIPGESKSSDSALSSCESGSTLLDWLSQGSVIYQWPEYVDKVPLSRIYEMADEGRRRADSWVNFARALEARSGSRKVAGYLRTSGAEFPEAILAAGQGD
jgi:hypothetical protein